MPPVLRPAGCILCSCGSSANLQMCTQGPGNRCGSLESKEHPHAASIVEQLGVEIWKCVHCG
eukprot:3629805-Amphidinium_carterae.1